MSCHSRLLVMNLSDASDMLSNLSSFSADGHVMGTVVIAEVPAAIMRVLFMVLLLLPMVVVAAAASSAPHVLVVL